MHFSTLLLPLFPFVVQGANIVLSNDDGWTEINIRSFYNVLTAVRNSVILFAPADNKSGTGSSDAPATSRTSPCEFNSCPSGSPATGSAAGNSRLNYVNFYLVTFMRYGLQTLSPKFFNGSADLAIAGFNVGANAGSTVLIFGTVGVAVEAVKEGVPGIAFSEKSGFQTDYTEIAETYVKVYIDLFVNVTQTLIEAEKPYLSFNIWLNVNYPSVSSSTCSSANKFKFVLSRINSASSGAAANVNTCGTTRLSTESKVIDTSGCYASISVGVATTKGDTTAAPQKVVQQKLAKILSCLP